MMKALRMEQNKKAAAAAAEKEDVAAETAASAAAASGDGGDADGTALDDVAGSNAKSTAVRPPSLPISRAHESDLNCPTCLP